MLYSIILFFILFELSITKEIDVYQLPFVITKSGAMIITDHEEKMSLSQDLLLIHKDVSCTTKIDLKRPTEAEIKAKSGTRKVFQILSRVESDPNIASNDITNECCHVDSKMIERPNPNKFDLMKIPHSDSTINVAKHDSQNVPRPD
ncbi:unnamed protein product [Schistosoma margrebowiei]|uniref:Uncharacterized protein n=1 Tax=Schistosoma margrebowiei TaxID=48269 RepID=A0A183LIK5_9TREM|nr:unnamed protein product [Schistosoma margrebowiei]